jgi:hypothetical protein
MFGSLASQLFTSVAAVAVAVGVFQGLSIAPTGAPSPSGPTFEWDKAFGDASTDWRTSVSGLGDTASLWRDRRAQMEADMLVLEDYLVGGNGTR